MQGSLKSSSAERMIDEYFGISDADGIVLCDTGLCGGQACSVKLRNIKVIGVDTDNIHSSAELRSVLSHELGHCKTDCFYSIGANKQEEGSGDKLLDFELKSGNKLSSIGTEDSGDSLKLSMYSNNAESGSLKVKSDGSLLSTGVIGHAAITYYCNDLQRTLPTSLSALDFSYYNATSNHFTEWSSDSDITIKRSGVVLLSAGLYTTWLKGAAEISLLINRQAKGSTSSDDLAETHFSRNQTDSNYYSGSVSITPIVFSVSEGDVLQLQGMVNSDSSHKEQMFGYLHWLTIQWLE